LKGGKRGALEKKNPGWSNQGAPTRCEEGVLWGKIQRGGGEKGLLFTAIGRKEKNARGRKKNLKGVKGRGNLKGTKGKSEQGK